MTKTAIDQDVQDIIEHRIASIKLNLQETTQKQYHIFVYGYKIHIAYSLMGYLKRINVAENERGVVEDNDETKYIVDRLWEELG